MDARQIRQSAEYSARRLTSKHLNNHSPSSVQTPRFFTRPTRRIPNHENPQEAPREPSQDHNSVNLSISTRTFFFALRPLSEIPKVLLIFLQRGNISIPHFTPRTHPLLPLAPPSRFVSVHVGVLEGGLPESSACVGADAEGGGRSCSRCGNLQHCVIFFAESRTTIITRST